MQIDFCKLFKSQKHGQIVVIVFHETNKLSFLYKNNGEMLEDFFQFDTITELNYAFDNCTRESVEKAIEVIKETDNEVTIQ